MAHLLANTFKDYFDLEETNIDNWAFKLFYKVSCGLCMVGATIGVASQYFGEPIRYHQRYAEEPEEILSKFGSLFLKIK